MIAGKTNGEILSMEKNKRYRWYKIILSKEKEKAMQIVEIIRRSRQRAAWTSEKRNKKSKAWTGKNNPRYGKIFSHTEESKDKMSKSKMGEKHPMYGKKRPLHSKRISGKNNPAKRPEVRNKISESHKGLIHSKEARVKMSISKIGKNHPNYKGGISFLPYCYLFNESKKEEVRNRYGRVCVSTDLMRSTLGSESGLDDFEGYEIFNGRRLAVHHIKGDKMAGCNGKEMALIPLQNKFNTKKFNGLRLEETPFYITLFMFKDIERKHREERLGYNLEEN